MRERESPGTTGAMHGAIGKLGRSRYATSDPDAKEVTSALPGGRWHGSYGTACCPAHGDREPSLSLRNGADGRLLARCFAGCSWIHISDALRGLGLLSGPGGLAAPDPVELARREAEAVAEEEGRREKARELWAEAVPIEGTLAEQYLTGRRITGPLSATLRFHPVAWCSDVRGPLPAMLAKVERDGVHIGTHRTYLAEPGGKADVPTPKKMLGSAKGGAVHLQEGRAALVVAEGIETALSVRDLSTAGDFALWATLGTSGMANLALPSKPGPLVIARDPGCPGQVAADALAERATAAGWSVRMLSPPADGGDWNDELVRRGRA